MTDGAGSPTPVNPQPLKAPRIEDEDMLKVDAVSDLEQQVDELKTKKEVKDVIFSLNQMDVSEIFSPPRVAEMATSMRFAGGDPWIWLQGGTSPNTNTDGRHLTS